jgi:septal ring factor EnvC (AmiA/AmiB activator)
MTLLNSIFVCKSNDNNDNNDNDNKNNTIYQDLEKLKDDVRVLENKFLNLQQDLKSLENKIDLLKDIIGGKIDNLVLLINQLRG